MFYIPSVLRYDSVTRERTNWQNVRAYVGVLGKVTGLRTLSSGCQRGGHSSAVAFKTRI